MEYSKQVQKNHYIRQDYDSCERFISYFNQKEIIVNVAKKIGDNVRILEIGKGNGLIYDYLKKMRFDIKSFDIDRDLNPDYLGDVTNIKEIIKDSYSIVACFEVLEHIKYEDFEKTLKQLYEITNNYLLISLPQSRFYLSVWFKIPLVRIFSFYLSVPFPIVHKFDGEHYWEVGKKGYSLKKVMAILNSFFHIQSHFVHPLDPYHRYFILKKS